MDLLVILLLPALLVPAVAGRGPARRLGRRLRPRTGRGPLRAADGAAGAVARSLAALIVAWAAAGVPAAASEPPPTVQQASAAAGFPQVSWADVAGPSGDTVTPAATRAARRSSVKIEGATGSQGLEGSGFVYAPEHVLTNAHVVAGIDAPSVRIGGLGRPYEARVVLFDPDKDVAVLYVPGLRAPVLRFDDDAERGEAAVVAGYPQDGGLELQAATIADRVRATGQDIYSDEAVTRDVYAIHCTVRPGNSGGPLLTPDGRVFGVVFARSTSDDGKAYVLTADEVAPEADRGADATAQVDTGELITS
ncbi:MarP family serine protease [Streptomyces sp. NPDC096205]|uniref:MarP family serine protease n=1 Tax=Streptomyces sp. NPDC096205 TaxID=3366081 RepID=UPI003814642F